MIWPDDDENDDEASDIEIEFDSFSCREIAERFPDALLLKATDRDAAKAEPARL